MNQGRLRASVNGQRAGSMVSALRPRTNYYRLLLMGYHGLASPLSPVSTGSSFFSVISTLHSWTELNWEGKHNTETSCKVKNKWSWLLETIGKPYLPTLTSSHISECVSWRRAVYPFHFSEIWQHWKKEMEGIEGAKPEAWVTFLPRQSWQLFKRLRC